MRAINNGLSSSIAARPNAVQGFGRYYLGDLMEGTQTYRLLDEDSFAPFTAAGQQRSGWLTVSDASKPVILVLAWTDEPASLPAGTTLVRNLDLEVDDGCTRYTGNRMNTSEVSIAQNSCGGYPIYDTKNNVEMIVIPAGTLTTFNYAVTVKSWGFGSHNQPFALFVANAQ